MNRYQQGWARDVKARDLDETFGTVYRQHYFHVICRRTPSSEQ